jgi:hypothetical protein
VSLAACRLDILDARGNAVREEDRIELRRFGELGEF